MRCARQLSLSFGKGSKARNVGLIANLIEESARSQSFAWSGPVHDPSQHKPPSARVKPHG
jgi:hypothetical protein